MKRIIALLLLAVLTLSACTPSSPSYTPTGDALDDGSSGVVPPNEDVTDRSLSLAYYPDKGLNPYQCSDYTNRLLFGLLYQSLFTVDSSYAVEPQLCKSYTVSSDMKTYVFYLERATFSDGTVLTASDVVASLEAARTGTVYGGRFKNVEQIGVSADGGVQIVLSTAYENLPLLLDVPIVRAAQVDADFPEGTGPYTLKSFSSGRQLWRRDNWWCSANLAVTAKTIPLVTAQSSKQIRDEFELGDVGVVCTNPGSVNYVDYRGNFDLWECENGVFLYLGCRAKSNVFRNDAVRQALTYAIDRDSLVRQYYKTFGKAATLPASPASPYYDEALAAQYAYAPEKLTQALAQAELTGSSIVLLVNKDDTHRVKVAQAIADMLTACSLEVTVRAYSGDAYKTALKSGSYDLHLGQTVLSPNMDLSAFFDSDGTLAYGGMSDSAISALCKNCLANAGNYTTLHKAVMSDAMLCPVAFLSYAVYAEKGLIDELSPARDRIFCYSLGKSMDDALIQS